MLRSIFLKECKGVLSSVTYLVFVAVLVLFAYTQLGSELKKIDAPRQNEKSYGMKYQEIPKIIMPKAVSSLYGEFVSNSYTAYPVGFLKNVKLSSKKQQEMAGILSQLTGISKEDFIKAAGTDKNGSTIYFGDKQSKNITRNKDGSYQATVPDKDSKDENKSTVIKDLTVDGALTYEKFLNLMKQADKIIGGGSKYNDVYLVRFGEVPKTYEEALSDYNDIIKKDKVTGAYARLFCDYLGIILAIFPVFISVAYGIKDRRAMMQELIYAREMSSLKIVAARFFSMVIMMFLPVLIMAVYTSIRVSGYYPGFNIDNLALIKYSIGWLLPTLMVSAAVGVFLTELTDTPIAIAAQGLWWFLGLFSGIRHIDGGYGIELILRHNTIGNTNVYLDNFNTLAMNRIGYTLFAILLIILTVWIYELKRRGKYNAYSFIKKMFAHS